MKNTDFVALDSCGLRTQTQLFILSLDPRRCARYHCDRHVPKLTLEAAQILSSAFHILSKELAEKLVREHKIYRPTHLDHPCVRWCAAARGNFRFTLALGAALADEFAERFGHQHASEKILKNIAKINLDDLPFPEDARTPFAQAMPERFRGPDAVIAYRRYYLAEKVQFARWAHGTSAPAWVAVRDPELKSEKESSKSE